MELFFSCLCFVQQRKLLKALSTLPLKSHWPELGGLHGHPPFMKVLGGSFQHLMEMALPGRRIWEENDFWVGGPVYLAESPSPTSSNLSSLKEKSHTLLAENV